MTPGRQKWLAVAVSGGLCTAFTMASATAPR